jgi:hypothetical protein
LASSVKRITSAPRVIFRINWPVRSPRSTNSRRRQLRPSRRCPKRLYHARIATPSSTSR